MTDPNVYNAPSTWYCDRCPRLITDPDDSLVVWQTTEVSDGFKEGGYLVVHKGTCDPEHPGSRTRYDYPLSQDVSDFLGWPGQASLLSMLSYGRLHIQGLGFDGGKVEPGDINEFVDLFRRMQTPWYEEARRHFRCAGAKEQFAEVGTDEAYVPELLRAIADHDGDCNLR